MTIDDLEKTYWNAAHAYWFAHQDEESANNMSRAGIRAVITALRNEIAFVRYPGDEWNRHRLVATLNRILTGGVDADPAAVCVWKNSPYPDFPWQTSCGVLTLREPGENCNCGKPIELAAQS